MNKTYRLLLALCAAAATLSSCSRANYAFNPATPAYLGSQPTRSVALAPAPSAEASATTPAVAVEPAVAVAKPATLAPASQARVAAATPKVAAVPAQIMQPAVAPQAEQLAAVQQRLAEATVAQPQAAQAKPNVVQRLMLKKLSKQLAKAQLNRQNTAQTTRVGGGLAIIIVGVALAIVGAIVSSGAVAIIGSVIIVIGLVVLLLSLL